MKKTVGKLIAASPEHSSDILYGGGFNAPDEVVYFELGRKKYLVLSTLEYARGLKSAKRGVEILKREDYFTEDDKERKTSSMLVNLSAVLGVARWQVPEDFPVLYAGFLTESGVDIEVMPSPFLPKRLVKNASEIRLLEKSMHATEESMCYARDILRSAKIDSRGNLVSSGRILTCEKLRSMIEGFLKEKGYSAVQTITACGSDASQPHNTGSGPVRAGEPVVIDIFPRSDSTGYWGDMTRTFCKGKPLPVVERAFEAVLEASREAEKMVRPGVRGTDVHNRAAEVMENAGFETGRTKDGIPYGFIHGLGHGIGLDIHEAPRISRSAQDIVIQKGNVFSNEPGLYHPSWGGIRLEDVLCVTENGSRNFYTMEKELSL